MMKTKSWLGTGLLIILGLALIVFVANAHGACPRYTPDPALMEKLQRSSPLRPEQKEQLETIARLKPPDRIGELALLEAFMKSLDTPFITGGPITGPVPLTVEIRWGRYPVPDPVKVEFDMDGDGIPEWTQPGYDPASGPRSEAYRDSYTYQKEGEYQFAVRIYDRAGHVTILRSLVRVLSLAAFDAELQTRWNDLKDALRRGDTSAALECIHTRSRARYHEGFSTLSNLPQKVDQILPAIQFVSYRRGAAIYEAVRTDAGATNSFDVRFAIDVDGAWRIEAF